MKIKRFLFSLSSFCAIWKFLPLRKKKSCQQHDLASWNNVHIFFTEKDEMPKEWNRESVCIYDSMQTEKKYKTSTKITNCTTFTWISFSSLNCIELLMCISLYAVHLLLLVRPKEREKMCHFSEEKSSRRNTRHY